MAPGHGLGPTRGWDPPLLLGWPPPPGLLVPWRILLKNPFSKFSEIQKQQKQETGTGHLIRLKRIYFSKHFSIVLPLIINEFVWN